MEQHHRTGTEGDFARYRTGGANDIVFRKSQAYSYADSSNLLKLSMNMVSVNTSSDEASAVRGRRRF